MPMEDRLATDPAARAVRAPRARLSLADFEVVGELGEGSFSRVALARLRETGEEYALKIMLKVGARAGRGRKRSCGCARARGAPSRAQRACLCHLRAPRR